MTRKAALAPLVLFLLTSCKGVQSALDPAGDQASGLYSIWNLMLVVCGFMYLLVIGFLAWAIWRARRKLVPAPPEVRPNDPVLERTLAAWCGLIVVGLVILISASFLLERAVTAADARSAMRVKVTGNQWWWRIEYQDGSHDRWVETANELHLPSGRPVELTLVANDVIHSFWVPNLTGKMDMVPGRENRLLITPRRPGSYRGQCAEFCGLQHAHMALDITVDTPSNFEAWRNQQLATAREPTDPLLVRGREVFEGAACVVCHRIDGTNAAGRLGPNLTHVASRKTIAAGTLPTSRGSLQGWIANPQSIKPGTTMPAVKLTNDDLNAVAAYLDSLA